MGPSDRSQLEKGAPGGVLCGQETPATFYQRHLGSCPGPGSEAPSSWEGAGLGGRNQVPGISWGTSKLIPVLPYRIGDIVGP